MTVTAAHNIRFSVSHTFTSGSNMAYVWSGTGGNSDWIRIELQDEETQADSNRNLTLCEVHVYDVTLSEYCTCDDPCNRNADNICSASKVCITPAAECPYENVALHKRATMSSKNGNSGDASLAVNGNTGTTFSGPGYTSDTTQWNCMETAVDTDFSPYWAVDLGQNYTVHHITIFRRSDKVCRREGTKDICDDPGRHRMRNTKVMVDGHTCTVITDTDVLELPEKYVTSCQTPLTGREVRLSRDDSSSEFGHVINLCELQVWACKPGRHGDTCQHGTSENSSVENPDCNSQDACTFGSSGTRLELKVWQIR
nr:hypothetical protein BaRGS_027823 [Batillaria attramentaria]